MAELKKWSRSEEAFPFATKPGDPMIKDLALRKISEFVAEQSQDFSWAEYLASKISDENERGFALGTLARTMAKNRSRVTLARTVARKIPDSIYRSIVDKQIN